MIGWCPILFNSHCSHNHGSKQIMNNLVRPIVGSYTLTWLLENKATDHSQQGGARICRVCSTGSIKHTARNFSATHNISPAQRIFYIFFDHHSKQPKRHRFLMSTRIRSQLFIICSFQWLEIWHQDTVEDIPPWSPSRLSRPKFHRSTHRRSWVQGEDDNVKFQNQDLKMAMFPCQQLGFFEFRQGGN